LYTLSGPKTEIVVTVLSQLWSQQRGLSYRVGTSLCTRAAP
jgi:hypothetical protein